MKTCLNKCKFVKFDWKTIEYNRENDISDREIICFNKSAIEMMVNNKRFRWEDLNQGNIDSSEALIYDVYQLCGVECPHYRKE